MALALRDRILALLLTGAGYPMRWLRRGPVTRHPRALAALRRAGYFPLRDHYYEPLIDTTGLDRDEGPRDLPGIDFALDRQVALLDSFVPDDRLAALPDAKASDTGFYFDNPNFGAGDAETWYHVVRHFRPARIVEIGSGHSTLIARLAIAHSDDPGYRCRHTCIEPYEMPWLERTGVEIVRRKLEDVDPALILDLDAGDILFIDSSHMIRPQGEVLLEFLQLLPRLRPGVIVHIHDIFSPRDYPMAWLEEPRFWNEQYLLEAFLCHNHAWEVLLAVNLLKHDRYDALSRVCPRLMPGREPGSFYLRRIA